MHGHVPLSSSPSALPLLPQLFVTPVHPGGAQGLRNSLIPSLVETAEHRHFLCTQRGPSTTLVTLENPPRHPKPTQKPMLLLPVSCTVTWPAAQLSLPFVSTPERLLHQTPLLSAPKSHCGGASSWCLSRALGCEHSPAKHPQPSMPQSLNKQQG